MVTKQLNRCELRGDVQLKTWLKHEVKAGRLTDVAALITEVQGGTRILQTACVEAKARKLGAITKLVPKVKKSIEQFVHSTKVLLAESGQSGAVKLGNLKHKNLQGDVVPQVIESDPEEEEEEEDDEGGEEDTNNGGSEDQAAAGDAAPAGEDEDDEATQ